MDDTIDLRQIDAFITRLQKTIDNLPDGLRKFHEQAAEVLKSELDASIASSINDSHGKIRAWQEATVGSKGGYAAIRPVKQPSGSDGAGAITNYLENGHKTRANPATAERRGKKIWVEGRYFYANTRMVIYGKIIEQAEQFVENIAKGLR